MSVMKLILDNNGDGSIRNENTIESSPRESYDYQEPVLVAALSTPNNDKNYYSHKNPSSEYTHYRKGQYYGERNEQSYRNSPPPKQKNDSQFMYNKMPLPCMNCKEWGHNAYHCKGAGKNGATGRRYAPVYCTNCDEWTWHGRNNRNCPTNQNNYNNVQDNQVPKTKRD